MTVDYLAQRWPFLFEHSFWGNSLGRWIVAIAIMAVIYYALQIAIFSFLSKGSRLLRRLDNHWSEAAEDVIAGTKGLFLLVLSLLIASNFLAWEPRAHQNINRVFLIFLLWQAAVWGLRFITRAFGRYIELNAADGSRATSLRAMSIIAKLLFIVILVLWGLDNFGVNIAALVAGLGIGGVAIALAVQNILGDLFASLTIVLDKPFVIGDFIVVGEFAGTIENIGLKTTRVRSLSGEQLVFSNADLLQSRIRNYRRMNERRVVFNVGVLYSTPAEKVEKIGEMIREIISSQSNARFDRAHFLTFADSFLNFEIVYFVLTREFLDYANLQQKINIEIFRRFKEEKIGFAFPTRSVHIESIPEFNFPTAAKSEL
jgi:small-conductance mechanosensitive channel